MFDPYKTGAARLRHDESMNRREWLAAGAAGLAVAQFPPKAAAANPLTPPKNGPILVAYVVGRGANVMDVAGAWEVFQDTMAANGDMPFRLALISDSKGPFEATGGLTMSPHFSFDDDVPQPNIIVMGAQGEHTPKKIAWIREKSRKADVTMSVCTGAFLLAKTGLLDGLKATTHHDFYDSFQKQFPKVQLVRDARYVENDGGALCSAGGITSGIELALRVVQRYFGEASANQAAYYMEYKRSPERPVA
jgi:transcriptional regulator GlxA family with amidase domain